MPRPRLHALALIGLVILAVACRSNGQEDEESPKVETVAPAMGTDPPRSETPPAEPADPVPRVVAGADAWSPAALAGIEPGMKIEDAKAARPDLEWQQQGRSTGVFEADRWLAEVPDEGTGMPVVTRDARIEVFVDATAERIRSVGLSFETDALPDQVARKIGGSLGRGAPASSHQWMHAWPVGDRAWWLEADFVSRERVESGEVETPVEYVLRATAHLDEMAFAGPAETTSGAPEFGFEKEHRLLSTTIDSLRRTYGDWRIGLLDDPDAAMLALPPVGLDPDRLLIELTLDEGRVVAWRTTIELDALEGGGQALERRFAARFGKPKATDGGARYETTPPITVERDMFGDRIELVVGGPVPP